MIGPIYWPRIWRARKNFAARKITNFWLQKIKTPGVFDFGHKKRKAQMYMKKGNKYHPYYTRFGSKHPGRNY